MTAPATTTIRIFESELQQIASVAASSPELETGGELLGLWSHADNPTVLAASVTVMIAGTPAPGSTRGATWFEQDADAHMELEKIGWERFGIQVVGLWHSHHRLGLRDLSSGDIRRTQGYSVRHNRPRYAEILTYLETVDGSERLETFLKPHVYDNAASGLSLPTRVVALPGISPVREAFSRIGTELGPDVRKIIDGPKRRRRDAITQYHVDQTPARSQHEPTLRTGAMGPGIEPRQGGQRDENAPVADAQARSAQTPHTQDDYRRDGGGGAGARATELLEGLLAEVIPAELAKHCEVTPNREGGLTLVLSDGRRDRLRIYTYIVDGRVIVLISVFERRRRFDYQPLDERSPRLSVTLLEALRDIGYHVR